MTAIARPNLHQRVAALDARLDAIVEQFSPATVSCCFSVQDMVLLDRIVQGDHHIRVFTLDTHRLHAETYALMQTAQARYDFRLYTYTPQDEALEHLRHRGVGVFCQFAPGHRCAIPRVQCCSAGRT